MDKIGDYKYGIILSLILGLMVLGMSFIFIFNELYTGDDVDRQVCRQSIQVRSLLPDFQPVEGVDIKVSFKNQYPLKCRTHVVEIGEDDVKDVDKVEVIIAESMAECWALFDKGDISAFPAKVFSSIGSSCVPCARIHLTNEAKDYLRENPNIEINIRDALDKKMREEYSYYTYLRDSGKKFSAFDLAGSGEFDLYGDGFEVKGVMEEVVDPESEILEFNEVEVDEVDMSPATFHNRLTGVKEEGADVSFVSLPKVFDVEKGDLLISYGIITSSDEGKIGNYIPYLFYFQTEDSEPFEEVKRQLIDGPLWLNTKFCDAWEGIPA